MKQTDKAETQVSNMPLITEVGFPEPFPRYDPNRQSRPEDSDPQKIIATRTKRPNVVRRLAEGYKNLSLKETVGVAAAIAVTSSGLFSLGHHEGVKSTERPPAAAPAVLGANEQSKDDEPIYHNLTPEQTKNLNNNARQNALNIISDIQKASGDTHGKIDEQGGLTFTYIESNDASKSEFTVTVSKRMTVNGSELTLYKQKLKTYGDGVAVTEGELKKPDSESITSTVFSSPDNNPNSNPIDLLRHESTTVNSHTDMQVTRTGYHKNPEGSSVPGRDSTGVVDVEISESNNYRVEVRTTGTGARQVKDEEEAINWLNEIGKDRMPASRI